MKELTTLECCAPVQDPGLDDDQAEAIAELFRTLSDPGRVKIVNLLANSDGPMCVCDLIEPLGVSQPTVSFHLKKLAQAGLIRREQRGTWAYYSLDRKALRAAGEVFKTRRAV